MRIDLLTPYIFKSDPGAGAEGAVLTLKPVATGNSVVAAASAFDSSTEHLLDFIAKRSAKLQMAALILAQIRKKRALEKYKEVAKATGLEPEYGARYSKKI